MPRLRLLLLFAAVAGLAVLVGFGFADTQSRSAITAAVFHSALPGREGAWFIGVDGHDPSEALLHALSAEGLELRPISQAPPGNAERLLFGPFRWDGPLACTVTVVHASAAGLTGSEAEYSLVWRFGWKLRGRRMLLMS